MLVVLLGRSDLDINVLHDRNPLFTQLSSGDIRNGYTFKVLNKSRDQRTFSISATGLDGMALKLVGSEDITLPSVPYVTVKPDRLQSFRLLITAPIGVLNSSSHDIQLVLTEINTKETAEYDTIFRGPEK